MENRDIIVIGLQPWYTKIGSNCKNIALEFSKHNRVLYVNAPLDRNTILRAAQDPAVAYHIAANKGEQPALVKVQDNFWNYYPDSVLESINWIPFTPLFSLLNRRNNKKFADSIAKAIQELDFRNVIIFNDNDMFRGYYLKSLLKPAVYVYYSRDYLLGVDYWRRHGQTLEPRHIANADVAVANSLYLTDMLKTYNPRSHYVGQGCDLRLFNADDRHDLPADLNGLTRPLIGYVGSLNSLRLDISVLETIAKERPSWNIVLVGPEDEAFRSSALHTMANVHFLGRKEVNTLPSYIQAFDVCLNPQLVNPVTVGNYPLKIDEYLAMGKPVVATQTKTMSLFADYVYLAERPAGYVPLIEKALQENTPSRQASRIAFARTHTWENSVNEIYKAVQSFESV
ncbi:glycosyltransferase [Chitinophaga cymbidii]|nr:glycosyltransferase [Chitinophaga cymbidii]